MKYIVLVLTVLLMACSPVQKKPVPLLSRPTPHTLESIHASSACPDLFLRGLTSTDMVSGAWDCLSPGEQASLNAIGVTGDDGIHRASLAPPVFTGYKLIGVYPKDSVLVYMMKGNGDDQVCALWIDSQGYISDVALTSHQG